MKKLLVCLLLPLLLCNFTTVSNRVAAVPEYIGPGQINGGGIEFVSCGRAYKWSYAAALSAACDLVDTATGLVTGTMHFLASGFVNVSELTGVGAACHVACSVTKMYDQTGSGNHVVQATLANMPGLTFNAQNGLPCAAGGATVQLLTAGNVVQAAPFTRTAVAERTGSVTTRQDMFANAANSGLRFAPLANAVIVNSGTTVQLTAADNAFHALLAVASATAPLFAVDSSANISTSSSGSTSTSGALAVMNNNVASFPLLSGFVCEAGIGPADLNSSYQAMLANMRSPAFGWNF